MSEAPLPPPTIDVTINGDPRALPQACSVAQMLQQLGIAPVRVAVERNRKIVRRAQHDTTTLEAGDAIEIVAFVGGG